MKGSELDRDIQLFLATCRTAALATVDDAGRPHAANVQYALRDGIDLLWVSSPSSAHSQHLLARPDAAITIYAHQDDAANIHGLQMHGSVQAIAGDTPEWNRAWEQYTRKFAFVASHPQFAEAVRSQAFYQFKPSWLRWIDNRRGFGWKHEVDFSAG
jgi:uncharacterized protein YhbP (UPF0306 family)